MNEQDRQNLFSELLARHQSELHAYIFAMVRRWDDADDLYQSVCLVLWRKFDLFRPGSNFFFWARQTAKIEVRNFLRHRQPSNSIGEELLDALSETDLDAQGEESGRYLAALRRCRSKLDAVDEELLEYRYVEDLGSREIADTLQRSQPSVCRSLTRVRRMLFRMHSHRIGSGGAFRGERPWVITRSSPIGVLEIAEAVCDETVSPEQLAELDSLMCTDPASRYRYLDYCRMHASLKAEMRAARATQRVQHQMQTDSIAEQTRNVSAASIASPPFVFLPAPIRSMVAYPSSGWPLAYLVATIALGIGLTIAAVTQVSELKQLVQQPVGPAKSTISRNPPCVGRITGIADCRWAGAGGPENLKSENRNLNSSVWLGDRFAIRSGLLEITYDTGAKVILQGPVTYEVESAAGGYLAVGKLTAKLEKKEEPGARNEQSLVSRSSLLIPGSSFAVRTPTAVVTDLGTEFGVEVDEKGFTKSHVFRGTVEVRTVSISGEISKDARILHPSDSAQVETHYGRQIVIVHRTGAVASFVRTIPQQSQNPLLRQFDLVDVVAGGNGFSDRRNAGIDPRNGQKAVLPLRKPSGLRADNYRMAGDGKYHRVDGLPFVDGVFIPNGGERPMQIDSSGGLFADFPKTANETGVNIWAGGAIPMPPSAPAIPTKLGDVDYASPGHGLLLMHANNGITFDLQAIRKANQAYRPIRFRAAVGNVETKTDAYERGDTTADVWVLLDGKVRFKLREINSYNGVLSVNIEIGNTNRFLTLVSTDGGNGIPKDWILFGDPRLELLPIEK